MSRIRYQGIHHKSFSAIKQEKDVKSAVQELHMLFAILHVKVQGTSTLHISLSKYRAFAIILPLAVLHLLYNTIYLMCEYYFNTNIGVHRHKTDKTAVFSQNFFIGFPKWRFVICWVCQHRQIIEPGFPWAKHEGPYVGAIVHSSQLFGWLHNNSLLKIVFYS